MSNESPSMHDTSPKKDLRFWLIFVTLWVSVFVAAIELTSMGTSLPSIVHSLGGSENSAWITTSYSLATTAVLPLNGRLAEVYGRRDVLLAALLCFALGSGICGGAKSMDMLIGGRVVQGIGSGGIQTLTTIIVSDLVTLKERGLYNGITGAAFTVAAVVGPFIGGGIVQATNWQWLFCSPLHAVSRYNILILGSPDINIPPALVAFVLVYLFVDLKRPERPKPRQILVSLDVVGNTLIIAGTACCLFALTQAGVHYSWTSSGVLAPLLVGVIILMLAIAYDARISDHPAIPLSILSNRTTNSGYFGSFIHGLVITSVTFYLPVYYQAVKLSKPLQSGLYILPMVAFISPSAIFQGIIVNKFGCYRAMNTCGWCLMLSGVGLLMLLDVNASLSLSFGCQVIFATGFGLLYSTTFSVLAPLDVSLNAAALSFLLFVRTLPQAWSFAIGATILQNFLKAHLPPTFSDSFKSSQDLTYVGIPQIPDLEEPTRSQTREAFAFSLRQLWMVMTVLCAVGLSSVVFQRYFALNTQLDRKWGRKEEREDGVGGDGAHKVSAGEVEAKRSVQQSLE